MLEDVGSFVENFGFEKLCSSGFGRVKFSGDSTGTIQIISISNSNSNFMSIFRVWHQGPHNCLSVIVLLILSLWAIYDYCSNSNILISVYKQLDIIMSNILL